MWRVHEVDEFLASKFKELSLPGLSCCIAYNNQVTTFNYGVGDLEYAVPVDDYSIFNIASVGKLLTTVCVFRLIDQGRLRLDTCLGDLLFIPQNWRSIQVSHLLSHSSGIKNYTDVPEYWTESQLDVAPERIIEYVSNAQLEFQPGTHWRYSNTGYYLLGLIVEQLSGMDYFDFAAQVIAGYKSGLKIIRTDDRQIMSGRVTGYVYDGHGIVKPPYYSNSGTFSAGGFSASLTDFIHFENALFNGKVLSNTSLNLIKEPYIQDDGSYLSSPDEELTFKMTHGLFRFDSAGMTYLAHGGEIFGYKTEYMRAPDKNFSVILGTNLSCNFDSLKMLDKVYHLTTAKP